MWRSESKSAARLRLCRLAAAAACDASRRGAALPYLRWFTFLFDLPGLSNASLMLLDAESMKLSRSRVASRTSPPSAPASSSPAGVPVSSSSKQQPLSRAPKAPPSPSGELPKPKGTNGCVLRSAAWTAIPAAPRQPAPRPTPPPVRPRPVSARGPGPAPALARCEQRSLLARGRARWSASRGSSLGLVSEGRREGAHGDRPGGGGEGLI
uniref:Uncharacterized protein n=1 Tax=Sus scrofa TaxID=9823 RepID=A0A8D0VNI4_PIG